MIKKYFSILMIAILLLATVPVHSFASELETNNNVLTENVEDLYESDFLNFEDLESGSLTYEEAIKIYNEEITNAEIHEEQKIQPFNLFRLLFSIAKSGANYIVKVSSKGKTIKGVRNGELKVDVSRHINAKNRFKDYGDIDKLVEYIVEDIRRLDAAGYVEEGDNTIKTVYGSDNKLLEIRLNVENGILRQFNAFPNHSNRQLGNVRYLAPQP